MIGVFDVEAGLLFGQAIHLLQRAADLAFGLGAIPPRHGLIAAHRRAFAEFGFGLVQVGARGGLELFDFARFFVGLAALLGLLVVEALLLHEHAGAGAYFSRSTGSVAACSPLRQALAASP